MADLTLIYVRLVLTRFNFLICGVYWHDEWRDKTLFQNQECSIYGVIFVLIKLL